MTELIPNFPPGPLDRYRKNASFDWKKFKIFMDSEEWIQFTNKLYEEVKKYPILYPHHSIQTLDDIRHETMEKSSILRSMPIIETLHDEQWQQAAVSNLLLNLDPSVCLKIIVSSRIFALSLLMLGTDRHLSLADDAFKQKISGCLCLTEIGHGTNVQGMRTTATYDATTKEFVLNTPDFEAAKCWAASLGQTATHAGVYAKLVTPDGVEHGLHMFVTPIRDPNTLLPLPGVTVGDMGPKAGLNGIDNGFLIFNNYRIPREYLLNKYADVNEAGQYISATKNRSETYGKSFSALSPLRIKVVYMAYIYLTKSITIAVRYAAVRKQFGPEGKDELPIIEYQLQQHRLLPHLAATYHLKLLFEQLDRYQTKIMAQRIDGKSINLNANMELHALTCAAKPIASWIARDGIQECREACGGHGYLKAAGISDLRNDNDANLTYEGENHVLIQQTSNWLLKFWPDILNRKHISGHFKSIDFLSNALDILKTKFHARNVDELIVPECIISIYQWLTCYLLKIAHEKFETNIKKGMDPFTAKNENQVFYSRSLGIAYIQHYLLFLMNMKIQEATDLPIKRILEKLLALYGLFSLEKHISVLYQGGYAHGEDPVNLIQEATLKLCSEIKRDAVSLVDAIAPPDFLLNSVLGASDGQVYNRLQSDFYQCPGSMTRPSWWKDMVDASNLEAKL